MKKVFSLFLIIAMVSLCLLSCGTEANNGTDNNNTTNAIGTTVNIEMTTATVDTEKIEVPDVLEEHKNTLVITCEEGTDNCWNFDNQTLTFSNIDAKTVCSISGEFDGQIVIDAGDDYQFELDLCGITLYSSSSSPITIVSGDKVTISAKKDTQNYIYDRREAVNTDDETVYSAAIWSKCDLDIQGKGELIIISEHNNGIHTKDDLKIKNLTLSVTCEDNALKGNDGVTISSGTITLIAKTGDGIKTTNTDISSKGNQRGIVTISSGTVTIYAACDGIDAAYDCDISGDATVTIYTHTYSPYSETVTVDKNNTNGARFIRFTSKDYAYSVKYYNSDTDYQWVNASFYKSVSGGRSSYYYYTVDKLEGYAQVQFFIYSSSQKQGQDQDYLVCSDFMTWNTSYDTFALEQRYNSLSYNWTNYTTNINSGMGGPGGFGGMDDGNKDKGDYSTKGIKAGNEIQISGGVVTISSYDDAIHANSDTTLENGNTPTGNVIITGGQITVLSKDDGIHADGSLTIADGTVNVVGSYEGLEGTTIVIDGGNISIVSSDDGMNATTTTGTGITFNGGEVYVYAGGDGLDSNSRTSYQGIVFNGTNVTVISTTSMNSSIDTEQGYTYKAGHVLAICPSNGMGSESTKCQNFTSIGTKTTMSLKNEQVLNVVVGGNTVASVTMPLSQSSLVIYLGSNSASFK